MTPVKYRVLTGLDHGDRRYEPGDEFDVPAKSVRWLLEQGAIESMDVAPPRRDEMPAEGADA